MMKNRQKKWIIKFFHKKAFDVNFAESPSAALLSLCACSLFAAAVFFIFTSTGNVSVSAEPVHGNNESTGRMIKELSSVQAFDMWKKNRDRVKIIDCRTHEEFVTGHPETALNIPIEFMLNGSVIRNPDFEAQVRKTAAETDTVMIICRTGRRSLIAAHQLIKAGFSDVINISDGFEGKKGVVTGSAKGNGWKHSGLPWTKN